MTEYFKLAAMEHWREPKSANSFIKTGFRVELDDWRDRLIAKRRLLYLSGRIL
jgi:hypothetical protein